MGTHTRALKYSDFPSQKHPLIKAILNHGGNPSAFAKALGIHPNKVYTWIDQPSVAPPVKYCREIERLSGGQVSREELRPDIFGEPLILGDSIEERFKRCIGMLNSLAAEIEYQGAISGKKHPKKGALNG